MYFVTDCSSNFTFFLYQTKNYIPLKSLKIFYVYFVLVLCFMFSTQQYNLQNRNKTKSTMGNSLTSNNTNINIIDEQIKKECIVMYSTTVCSFCTKAKALMDEMGLQYSTVEIDKIPPTEGGRVSHDLRAKTRIMTVK